MYNLCTDNNNFAAVSGTVTCLGLILLYCCPKTLVPPAPESTDSGHANPSEAKSVFVKNPMVSENDRGIAKPGTDKIVKTNVL